MENRFSKEQLLDIYKSQQSSEAPTKDVSSLYANGWDPGHSNGANGRGWGKSTDGRDTHGPHICWDDNGNIPLISLQEMTELERNVSHSTPPINTVLTLSRPFLETLIHP
jgi:PERQ amino acid-rich with GYF domain-containing protein